LELEALTRRSSRLVSHDPPAFLIPDPSLLAIIGFTMDQGSAPLGVTYLATVPKVATDPRSKDNIGIKPIALWIRDQARPIFRAEANVIST